MNAGGYTNSAFWSSAGWFWKVSRFATQPDYWAAQQNFGGGPQFTQSDCYPVVGVTYYEAEAYCNWAGGHLPTEAQWEKAARWNLLSSYPNVYPWCDIWDTQKCNNINDSLYPAWQTVPVGSYASGASPYGCMDMAGNVWEWCKDWYGLNYYYTSPANDPQGPFSGIYPVMRGCSWGSYDDYYYKATYRYGYFGPYNSWSDLGFRLVRD
jgi:formylglycine-generating enzyme required for sulfatase activity